MPRFNEQLAEWAKQVFAERGLSLRSAEIKSGVSATTIHGMLAGKAPGAMPLIKFATAMQAEVPAVLRLAGYEEEAELWETGAMPHHPPRVQEEQAPHDDQADDDPGHDLADDERDVLQHYRGLPANLQPAAREMIRTLREAAGGYEPGTYDADEQGRLKPRKEPG